MVCIYFSSVVSYLASCWACESTWDYKDSIWRAYSCCSSMRLGLAAAWLPSFWSTLVDEAGYPIGEPWLISFWPFIPQSSSLLARTSSYLANALWGSLMLSLKLSTYNIWCNRSWGMSSSLYGSSSSWPSSNGFSVSITAGEWYLWNFSATSLFYWSSFPLICSYCMLKEFEFECECSAYASSS